MPPFERTGGLNMQFRARAALVVVLLVFFIIIVRLWYLQVVEGNYFRDRSENNRLQTVFIPPPRGLIKDRNGKDIVANRPSFNVELIAEDTPDEKQSVRALARVIGVETDSLIEKLRQQKRRRKFEPKLLLKDASRDVVAKVAAARYRLPGIIVSVVPARNYLYGDIAAHVLGYVREITQKQLESPRYPGYMLGDIIGQYGLESRWEQFLQGQRGRQRVIVNATGTRVGELSSDSEVSGSTINLTLDFNVQKAADAALEGKKGAIVAIDPRTGEILALSSSPRFDPNMFAGELTAADRTFLQQDKKEVNRAVQGTYPPGSVFKIFMALGGLSEGVITPKDHINCSGSYRFAGRDYRCWLKTGHGTVELLSALTQSCDVYFYTVGQRLGIDGIKEYASLFGLGEKTGIELSDESSGLVPSQEWKRQRFHERWYPGETLSVSIGQGAVTVTPLQITNGVGAVVNGGTLYRPTLVKSIISSDGHLLEEVSPEIVRNIKLKPEIVKAVKEGLVNVVNGARGTARKAQLNKALNITVGGKTGTAQVAGLQHGNKGHLMDHAWFVGYAPADDPKIVVGVVVENGGHGGSTSAPLAKQVMEAYFDPDGKIISGETNASGTPSPSAPPEAGPEAD